MDLETLASMDDYGEEYGGEQNSIHEEQELSSLSFSPPVRRQHHKKHHHHHRNNSELPPPPPPTTTTSASSSSSSAADEYKVRYNVLREMYEQRLRGLVTQMHSVYADTTRDAAVQALGDSAATLPFQQLRRQEVVQEAIESDAEHSYRKVAHNLAKTESQLHKANQKIQDLKRQVRHLNDHDEGNGKRAQLELRQHKKSTRRRTATRRPPHKGHKGHHGSEGSEDSSRAGEQDSMLSSKDSEEENDHSSTAEEESKEGGRKNVKLNKRLDRMEHLLERVVVTKAQSSGGGSGGTSSSEQKNNSRKNSTRHGRSRSGSSNQGFISTEDEDDELKKAGEEDRNIEHHPLYVAMVTKVNHAKRLLAQSEQERLELRSKYIAIGQNVEQLIRTDSIAENNEIVRLRAVSLEKFRIGRRFKKITNVFVWSSLFSSFLVLRSLLFALCCLFFLEMQTPETTNNHDY